MRAKRGYVLVLSILMVLASSIISIALFTQIDATVRRVGYVTNHLKDESDALKALALSAAYLRSKFSVASGFDLSEHPLATDELNNITQTVLRASGPAEKAIWQQVFSSFGDDALVRDLMKSGGARSSLGIALFDSNQKGLIETDFSDLRVLVVSSNDINIWQILLYVESNTAKAWTVVGPEGFFNYAVFLPNGIPSYSYYGTGEVIDGPSWFGVDENGYGGLGIGGNPGPRFYGKTFYKKLRKYYGVSEDDVFLGGRVILKDEEVTQMRESFQGKTYWDKQIESLFKVDIIDTLKSGTPPASSTGLILTYSKLSGGGNIDDDVVLTSEIIDQEGQKAQLIKIRGPEGYFELKGDHQGNNKYQVDILVPYPGPPNVPVTLTATETKPNGDTDGDTEKTYSMTIADFNGFLAFMCDTTNSYVALGEKGKWTENIFMGDWTILVMGNKGRQQEQTPWDELRVYGDLKYYSATGQMELTVDGETYLVNMDPFFDDGTPIPNNRDVQGQLTVKDVDSEETTTITIDGKTFWDAWYGKLAQEDSTKDHVSIVTTADISTPWHDGYLNSDGSIRNIRMDMSAFIMYWDRNRKPGSPNSPNVPTLKVDYNNFEGLGYRVIFGSIASEAVTPTWSGSNGLKEFNIFDKRLYSAKQGLSPMTGATLLEGLRVR